MSSLVFEYCALAMAVSLTAVVVAGSFCLVLGILSVIFGKDADN